MAHGYYDYGVSREVKTVHATPDMAEQAVRVGAVSSVDRRGNVVEYDDFEPSTFRWTVLSIPGGYEPTRSTDYANSGSFSVKMPLPPGANNGTFMNRCFGAQVTGKIGMEFKFTLESFVVYLDLSFEAATGVDSYLAYVRYNFNTRVMAYWDSTGAWQPLATNIQLLNLPAFFHPMKLVADSQTGYYVRLIFDGVEYDMTQYRMQRTVPELRRFIATQIAFYNLGAVEHTHYVDDVIITQNEP